MAPGGLGVGAVLAAALLVAVGEAPAAPASGPLVDASRWVPAARIDMRYATPHNLAGVPLYPASRCLLRPQVAAMLARAQAALDAQAGGLRLLLLDCYRPHSAQVRLYEAVPAAIARRYVANPRGRTGSVHSYGAAVDVSLCTDDGRELDMGTPFDALDVLAEPQHEAALLAAGRLSPAARANRLRLRAAMVGAAGFLGVSNEWWHFDALRGAALRRRYARLDVSL